MGWGQINSDGGKQVGFDDSRNQPIDKQIEMRPRDPFLFAALGQQLLTKDLERAAREFAKSR